MTVFEIKIVMGAVQISGHPMAPIRHPAKRRRIRTVMQELLYLAARVLRTGRRIKLAFGKQCRVKPIFDQFYARLAYG